MLKKPHHLSALIVQDNEIQQILLSTFCDRLGIRPTVVPTCDEAMLKLGKQAYDVILMDWKIHSLDGPNCALQIRAQEHLLGLSYAPIVAVTARVMPGDKEKCLKAGMDDYLSKPFQFAEFAQMMNYWANKNAA